MGKFVCKRCNYRFNAEKTPINRKCPYCGEIGRVIPEQSAEDLINEVG